MTSKQDKSAPGQVNGRSEPWTFNSIGESWAMIFELCSRISAAFEHFCLTKHPLEISPSSGLSIVGDTSTNQLSFWMEHDVAQQADLELFTFSPQRSAPPSSENVNWIMANFISTDGIKTFEKSDFDGDGESASRQFGNTSTSGAVELIHISRKKDAAANAICAWKQTLTKLWSRFDSRWLLAFENWIEAHMSNCSSSGNLRSSVKCLKWFWGGKWRKLYKTVWIQNQFARTTISANSDAF